MGEGIGKIAGLVQFIKTCFVKMGQVGGRIENDGEKQLGWGLFREVRLQCGSRRQ
jgi:hypothetical protein